MAWVAYLPPCACASACLIFELVIPHKDTARATGDDRNIVMALTSGVLNSHIFTGDEETSVMTVRAAISKAGVNNKSNGCRQEGVWGCGLGPQEN